MNEGDAPITKTIGIPVGESEHYSIIAQSERDGEYENVLRIPKVAIVSITVLGAIVIFLSLKPEYRAVLLAFFH